MELLLDLLKNEGTDLARQFDFASKLGSGSSDEVADFREHAVQDFLRRFYPQSYVLSKNKITSLDGAQSNSVDCVIVNPAHPALFDSKGDKFLILFADGCDAAIEIKPDLGRSDELIRAMRQGVSVKKTRRSKSPIMLPGPDHIRNHSLHIPFWVFCLKAFDPPSLYNRIAQFYRNEAVPVEEQLDGICINNLGIVRQFKHAELSPVAAADGKERLTGWYWEVWGSAALLGFLIGLDKSFSAVPSITSSILGRAMSTMSKTLFVRLGDLVTPTIPS